MDLFPTIAQAAGIELTATDVQALDGQSLTPLLKQPEGNLQREALYFHYPHYYATTTPASAIRAVDWKLLEYLEDGRLELFNLKLDPSEEKDLAEREAARAKQLRDKLHEWRKHAGVQMPTRTAGK